MSQQFTIFHDAEYLTKEQSYTQSIWHSLLNGTTNTFFEHCYFDNNVPHEVQGFYVATAENNKVCYECTIAKDPQIINILKFITTGKDYQAKLNKFNMGMDELRRIAPVADPAATKCPICKHKKSYKQSFDGHYGFKCNECNIGYIGNGVFYYNGKLYNLEQAKKIFKMKAFK